MLAGWPVTAASAMASWNLPVLPRVRKPVTLCLPGCPHSSYLSSTSPIIGYLSMNPKTCFFAILYISGKI
jgi:hypothetical protein